MMCLRSQITLTLLVPLVLFLLTDARNTSNSENTRDKDACKLTKCRFEISNTSVKYFRSRLKVEDPNFIKFDIQIDGKSYNATPDVFEPTSWVWTYNSSRGMYPYLSWNVDFGLLSFGLLEAKTLPERPYVLLTVQPRHRDAECTVTFGTHDTTKAIVCALERLMDMHEMQKYQTSYYCFLAKKPGVQNSFLYTAALYLLYPVDYINYNCCVISYSYSRDKIINDCMEEQIVKWKQCTILPYILGIILFLFCPILMFRIGESLSLDLPVVTQEYEMIREDAHNDCTTHDKDWVYLSHNSPHNVLNCLSKLWCGIDRSHPILVSRIKRFLLLILVPTPVFIQLLIYNNHWVPGLVQKFVRHGAPMGFLTLLGDKSDREMYFVPLLGGGVIILLSYGIIGLVIIVFPYSLKQIYEDGISRSSNTFNSPLCLGIWEILDLSSIAAKSSPGYGYCADVTVGSLYLIFSPRFWVRVFAIQYNRFCTFLDAVCRRLGRTSLYLLALIISPFYILICIVEAGFCVIWYGIPFLRLLNFLFRGVIISLLALKRNSDGRPMKLSLLIRNPFVFGVVFIILFAVSTFFTYTYCLIFIQSFQFLSQVLVFCFVAVIVYPAIAFGYLFFFIMLIYYMFHMIRGFGDGYLLLLSEAVEISRHLDCERNYTTTIGSTLKVSNIKVHGINRIEVEGKVVPLPQNFFQSNANDTLHKPKVRMRHNAYGIPRKLFSCLIEKHRPTNERLLKILFQLVLITLLLAITMSITGGFVTGPTSEISDVMHVIFIVTIGALPRILEVAMSTSNESVKREIELRELEQTIVRFWQREEMEPF